MILIVDDGYDIVTIMKISLEKEGLSVSTCTYTFGNGAIVSKVGSGILTFTFDAIGHYLQDWKLHDTGHIIIKSTSGNLASFGDNIGLYKDWYDTSGNGMTTMWFWKG